MHKKFTAIVLVVLCAIVPLAVGIFSVYWAMPQRLGVSPDEAYALLQARSASDWLITTPLLWAAIALGFTGYELFRLRTPQRWRLDTPYSVWRVIKSCLVVFGWAGVLGLPSVGGMGDAIYNIRTLERQTNQWGDALAGYIALAGVVALILALIMVIFDQIMVNNIHRQPTRKTKLRYVIGLGLAGGLSTWLAMAVMHNDLIFYLSSILVFPFTPVPIVIRVYSGMLITFTLGEAVASIVVPILMLLIYAGCAWLQVNIFFNIQRWSQKRSTPTQEIIIGEANQ